MKDPKYLAKENKRMAKEIAALTGELMRTREKAENAGKFIRELVCTVSRLVQEKGEPYTITFDELTEAQLVPLKRHVQKDSITYSLDGDEGKTPDDIKKKTEPLIIVPGGRA